MAAVMLPPSALGRRDAPDAPASPRSQQRSQAEYLLAQGFVMRNTFLVEASPSEDARRRRARSAPPQPLELGSEDKCSSRASRTSPSSASTDVSDGEKFDLGDSEAGSPAPAQDLAWPADASGRRLAELVERECAFLRIRGHTLQPLGRGQMKHGATLCLRFFVHGLPFTRRSRWQQPLTYSMLAVLKRCGCEAFVRGGELYASEDKVVVRVDFAAGRH